MQCRSFQETAILGKKPAWPQARLYHINSSTSPNIGSLKLLWWCFSTAASHEQPDSPRRIGTWDVSQDLHSPSRSSMECLFSAVPFPHVCVQVLSVQSCWPSPCPLGTGASTPPLLGIHLLDSNISFFWDLSSSLHLWGEGEQVKPHAKYGFS